MNINDVPTYVVDDVRTYVDFEICSNRRDRVPILPNIHYRGCTSHSLYVLVLFRYVSGFYC